MGLHRVFLGLLRVVLLLASLGVLNVKIVIDSLRLRFVFWIHDIDIWILD